MKIEESYIQYAAGYNKENVSKADIKKAINDLELMDEEHGAFWVGVCGKGNDEIALELHKDLFLFGHFDNKENDNLKIKLNISQDSEKYFDLLLNGKIEELKRKMHIQ